MVKDTHTGRNAGLPNLLANLSPSFERYNVVAPDPPRIIINLSIIYDTSAPQIRCTKCKSYTKLTAYYDGYSKINLRLVGKNKRVVIASKRTLSSNKKLLFLLYAYPHTFSPRSVGVNTDKTWTLSSPLPPAVRYVL